MILSDFLAGLLLLSSLFFSVLSYLAYRRSGVRRALAASCLLLIISLKNALYVVEILIPSLLPFPLGPETFLIDLLLIALLFVLIIRRRSAGR